MDYDIAYLKIAYARDYPFKDMSYRKWAIGKSSELNVSISTVYYHTDDRYQAKMKAKNAKVHSKSDLKDYESHRADEIKRRVDRWNRNPDLREWHYRVSAKNEKRVARKTVLGKPLC